MTSKAKELPYPRSCPWFVRAMEWDDAAEQMIGVRRQEAYLFASYCMAICASRSPDHLPKWRVRLWTSAVLMAERAGLPKIAAAFAREHLAKTDLSTRVMRTWNAGVLERADQ